jgi:hypothetical protein
VDSDGDLNPHRRRPEAGESPIKTKRRKVRKPLDVGYTSEPCESLGDHADCAVLADILSPLYWKRLAPMHCCEASFWDAHSSARRPASITEVAFWRERLLDDGYCSIPPAPSKGEDPLVRNTAEAFPSTPTLTLALAPTPPPTLGSGPTRSAWVASSLGLSL